MLIPKPKQLNTSIQLSEVQKVATEFLPKEQVTKFSNFQHLIEAELANEAREPEIENVIKDIFNALHENSVEKLLKTLQGDKKVLFYAFKKQLQNTEKLTTKQAKILDTIQENELSLLTIALLK